MIPLVGIAIWMGLACFAALFTAKALRKAQAAEAAAKSGLEESFERHLSGMHLESPHVREQLTQRESGRAA